MIWIILGIVVAIILVRFFSSLNNDNRDLQGRTLDDKFNVIVRMINDAAFDGGGSVATIDKREFNLYEEGQNQIIKFHYSTGHLTITWKYKYFQKEIVHEKFFQDVRNISLFQQQKIAENMISEMGRIIRNHKNNVLNEIE